MKLQQWTSGVCTAVALSMVFGVVIASGQEPRGAVYTMTNAPSGNQVVVYNRRDDGILIGPVAFDTGGTGTGGSLGNQNALVLDAATHCLYAANAGSNDITSFTVEANGLTFVEKINSGGLRPVSITVHGSLVYVLNAGGSVGGEDNISGFTVDRNCDLSPLDDSPQPLSAAVTAPAQVEFTPDGTVLVVTEKATNIIDTYIVTEGGLAIGPTPHVSNGATPFGFAFGKRNQLFVSEAQAGAPGGGTVSSYVVSEDGDLQLVTGSLPTNETATCWVVVSNDGRFAYVTNTGDESVSGLRISFAGNLSLVTPSGHTGRTFARSTPIDLALSHDGLHLYALDNTLGTIVAFRVDLTAGTLVRIQRVTGLPPGSNGLTAR